jgi:hypothetical protein
MKELRDAGGSKQFSLWYVPGTRPCANITPTFDFRILFYRSKTRAYMLAPDTRNSAHFKVVQ